MGAGTQLLLTPRLPLSLCPWLPPGWRGRRVAVSVLRYSGRQLLPWEDGAGFDLYLGDHCFQTSVGSKSPRPLCRLSPSVLASRPSRRTWSLQLRYTVTSPVKPSRKPQEPPSPLRSFHLLRGLGHPCEPSKAEGCSLPSHTMEAPLGARRRGAGRARLGRPATDRL